MSQVILLCFFACSSVTAFSVWDWVPTFGSTNGITWNGVPIPDQVDLVADSCDFWQKEGSWKDRATGNNLVHWSQRCESLSSSDVILYDGTDTSQQLGRTDEKLASITTQIRIRDTNDNIAAWLEEIITWEGVLSANMFTQYQLTDADANTIGTSDKAEVWNTVIEFDDVAKTTVAIGTQTGLNKIARSICLDGKWQVNFAPMNTSSNDTSYSTLQQQRWIVLSSLTTKLIRDTQRDSGGNVQASTCQTVHAIAVILGVCIPVGVLCLCGLYCYYRRDDIKERWKVYRATSSSDLNPSSVV